MSRLTRDRTAEPISRDRILRRVRGQGTFIFPFSADHKQDWKPYPIDPYSAICDDHTYIHHAEAVRAFWPVQPVAITGLLEGKLCDILKAMAPTNVMTVYQTCLFHIESNLD